MRDCSRPGNSQAQLPLRRANAKSSSRSPRRWERHPELSPKTTKSLLSPWFLQMPVPSLPAVREPRCQLLVIAVPALRVSVSPLICCLESPRKKKGTTPGKSRVRWMKNPLWWMFLLFWFPKLSSGLYGRSQAPPHPHLSSQWSLGRN